MTIDELYVQLAQCRKKGMGNKKILLTTDDECNGLHEMFYSVTPVTKDFSYCHLPFNISLQDAIENYVILG